MQTPMPGESGELRLLPPTIGVIVVDGFPVVGSKSDLLEGSAVNDVVLPETWR